MNAGRITKVVQDVFSDADYVFYNSQRYVKEFLTFAENVKEEKEAVSYNILLICDDEKKSENYCIKLLEAARNSGIFNKGFVMYDLDELYDLKPNLHDMEEKYSILVITKGNENNIQDKKNWDALVRQFTLGDKKKLYKVFCVNKAGAGILAEQYSELFHKYFPNAFHLELKSADENEIYEQLIQKLRNNGYACTKGFLDDIKKYIFVVYSKATLKDRQFVNDLYDRIVRAVLTRESASKDVDKECVPFYRKNSGTQIPKTEIPPSTQIVSNGQKEEKVLFLTLSTMNSPTMYKYEGSAKFIGISQLEAGTKNILFELAQNGQKLNRIVIVESEAARVNEIAGIEEDFWDDPEYMRDKIKSAVCFYKQRIRDYIRRNYSKKILVKSEKAIVGYDEFETHFPYDVDYSEEELGALFYDIPTDTTEDREKGIYREESLELFMKIIHGIKGNRENGEKKIHLYIDTQGGTRSAIQQINAVLELLKNQNVTIMGRYAVPNFDYRDQKRIYPVKEVGEAYKTYELVSSMTEFKQYGRGNGLALFFDRKDDEFTGELINVIQKISGAIAICNIVEFEDALERMKKLKKKLEEGKVSGESQIKIVFEDIVENYDFLLKENRTQFDIVKWCVDHYYYQQAITIIESRMPKMLVECGLLHYNAADVPKCVNSLYPYPITIEELCKEICKKINKEWEKAENYLFEQWLYSNQEPKIKKQGVPAKYFGNSLVLSGNLHQTWRGLCGGFSKCQRLSCRLKEDKNTYNFNYEEFDRSVRENIREHNMFRMFATLSKMLKEARNEINHANSKVSEVQVRDALDAYIQMGEALKLNEKWQQQQKG